LFDAGAYMLADAILTSHVDGVGRWYGCAQAQAKGNQQPSGASWVLVH
jgi:hypothetical protein